jgi:chaperonin GroES
VATSKKKVKAKAKSKVKAKVKNKVKNKVKKTLARKPAAKSAAVTKKSAVKKAVTKKPSAKKAKAVNKKPALKIPADFITPLEDRVLVIVEGPSEKTAGGLYIPETVSERPHRGQILALGRGRRNKKGQLRPLDVQAGDTVLFSEFAGTKVTLEGQEFLILREEDVLGIVN